MGVDNKTRSLPPSAQSLWTLKRNLYAEEKRSFGGDLKFKTIKRPYASSGNLDQPAPSCSYLFIFYYDLV